MSDTFYRGIGKATVKFAIAYVRRRFRGQLRVAAAVAVVSIAAGAYLATRSSVDEG